MISEAVVCNEKSKLLRNEMTKILRQLEPTFQHH